MLRTEICEMLDIEYPICLAGMGSEATPKLVAAVSNAGGLGVLGRNSGTRQRYGAAYPSPEELRSAIKETRKLTKKPFGVDLLMPSGVPDKASIDELKAQFPKEHVAFIDKLKAELGLGDFRAPERGPVTLENTKALIDVVLEEDVPVFVAGLGDPGFMVPEAHRRGIKVMALAGNLRHARRQVQAGVDVVIAQGYDAGGHTGRIGTFSLVPQVVDAVSPIPVLAAGGIMDGRGLAAALALGATGIWCGTVFLGTKEAEMPDSFIEMAIPATEADTVIHRVFTGKTNRTIKNKLVERWEREGPPPLPMPLQSLLIADLYYGLQATDKREYLMWSAGQGIGMLKELKTVKEVIGDMVEGALKILG